MQQRVLSRKPGIIFLHASFLSPTGKGPRLMNSSPQDKSELCLQTGDWTSDQCQKQDSGVDRIQAERWWTRRANDSLTQLPDRSEDVEWDDGSAVPREIHAVFSFSPSPHATLSR